MIRVLFATLFLLMTTTASAAESASDKSVRELFSLMNVDSALPLSLMHVSGDAFAQIKEQAMGIVDFAHDKGANAIYEKYFSTIAMGLAAKMQTDEPVRSFGAFYAQRFTQPEIDEMIRFYSSPVGRKVSGTVPLLDAYSTSFVQGNIDTEAVRALYAALKEYSRNLPARNCAN